MRSKEDHFYDFIISITVQYFHKKSLSRMMECMFLIGTVIWEEKVKKMVWFLR